MHLIFSLLDSRVTKATTPSLGGLSAVTAWMLPQQRVYGTPKVHHNAQHARNNPNLHLYHKRLSQSPILFQSPMTLPFYHKNSEEPAWTADSPSSLKHPILTRSSDT